MTASGDEFTTMVSRLSRLSVERHFDAYADVDWDGPELALDPRTLASSLPPPTPWPPPSGTGPSPPKTGPGWAISGGRRV